MKKINLLISAGGTGGHLFPAMAVADELTMNNDIQFEAIFVGNSHRIEGKVVPQSGYRFYDIPMIGLRGKFSLRNLLIPFKTLKSITICKNLIRENDIDAVLCTGAYLSYPAGIAASIMKKPLILMESNVYPGKTIKALSTRSRLIFTSFEESFNYLNPGRNTIIKNLGNPVRKQLLNLPTQENARKNFGLKSDKKTLLVFGGSLGALSINQSIDKLIKSGKADNYQIIWQTGNNFKPMHENVENLKILNFIDDMASAYAAADLVLARSGATTIAELSVTGKPSILVPYPKAANNHQDYNAELYDKLGAGFKIKDNQLWEKIEYLIPELLGNPEKLKAMSTAASLLAKTNASKNASEEIIRLVTSVN